MTQLKPKSFVFLWIVGTGRSSAEPQSTETQDPDQEQAAETGCWKTGIGTLPAGSVCHHRGWGEGRRIRTGRRHPWRQKGKKNKNKKRPHTHFVVIRRLSRWVCQLKKIGRRLTCKQNKRKSIRAALANLVRSASKRRCSRCTSTRVAPPTSIHGCRPWSIMPNRSNSNRSMWPMVNFLFVFLQFKLEKNEMCQTKIVFVSFSTSFLFFFPPPAILHGPSADIQWRQSSVCTCVCVCVAADLKWWLNPHVNYSFE